MLEVVFSDSAKGAMKMAKNYNKSAMLGGATAYIGKKPSKAEIKKQKAEMFEGEAIGGSPQDIVSFGFYLDAGDISGEINGDARRDVFLRLFSSVAFEPQEIDRFFQSQSEDFARLIVAANGGEPVRIWKSNAPYSACGFAALCHALHGLDCRVSVVSLPEYWETAKNTVQTCADWGEIQPGQVYKFLPLERELSAIDRQMQASLWTELKNENAPLRALVNGHLISVPEDFYDHLILKSMPEGEFVMARLIGSILCKYPLGISDGWYALRIKKMIAQNKLAIIADKDPSHPYGKILKRV
jgi:hypothetical protein